MASPTTTTRALAKSRIFMAAASPATRRELSGSVSARQSAVDSRPSEPARSPAWYGGGRSSAGRGISSGGASFAEDKAEDGASIHTAWSDWNAVFRTGIIAQYLASQAISRFCFFLFVRLTLSNMLLPSRV